VQKIAGLCKKVLCYDAYPANDWIKTIPNAEYVPMDQLFAESNIISIHVPLLPETHHLINKVYEDFTFVRSWECGSPKRIFPIFPIWEVFSKI